MPRPKYKIGEHVAIVDDGRVIATGRITYVEPHLVHRATYNVETREGDFTYNEKSLRAMNELESVGAREAGWNAAATLMHDLIEKADDAHELEQMIDGARDRLYAAVEAAHDDERHGVPYQRPRRPIAPQAPRRSRRPAAHR